MVKYKYELKDKMNVKTLRLKDSLSTIVYSIAKEKNLTESEYIRSLIEKDISEYRLLKAIENYKNKLVNLSGASEIAGIPYREFMEKLDIKEIPLNMDTIPIEYGINSIKKSLKKK
ncbi:MAG: hypothetical protein WCF78_03500 [archaeon]